MMSSTGELLVKVARLLYTMGISWINDACRKQFLAMMCHKLHSFVLCKWMFAAKMFSGQQSGDLYPYRFGTFRSNSRYDQRVCRILEHDGASVVSLHPLLTWCRGPFTFQRLWPCAQYASTESIHEAAETQISGRLWLSAGDVNMFEGVATQLQPFFHHMLRAISFITDLSLAPENASLFTSVVPSTLLQSRAFAERVRKCSLP